MTFLHHRRAVRQLVTATALVLGLGAAWAQGPTSPPAPAPSAPVAPAPKPGSPAPTAMPDAKAPAAVITPAQPAPATPAASPPPAAVPDGKVPDAKTPDAKALGQDATPPAKTQIEPNAAPGIPDNATTENVNVPARPIAMISGQSSYDDAFKSIKTSLDAVVAAMAKAGLTASGHPITIFSEPDENGFKYTAGVPLAAKPEKTDLGGGVSVGESPAGKAIKFQHRGGYEDIDSTYDVITAFLDAKGLQVGNPYIEEYLTDLKTPDDPNLQVDIYVFVK